MIESNITAEEKLMYQVMGALYDSGVPVTFKGAMVLRAFLLEAGYPEETRHTTDIDGNWNSETAPSGEEMTEAIQNAFEKRAFLLQHGCTECMERSVPQDLIWQTRRQGKPFLPWIWM